MTSSDITARHVYPALGPLGISGPPVSHHPPRPHQIQQDLRVMGKPYSQYSAEPLVAGGLEELRGSNVIVLLRKLLFSTYISILI